jgi:hypothetical protein
MADSKEQNKETWQMAPRFVDQAGDASCPATTASPRLADCRVIASR